MVEMATTTETTGNDIRDSQSSAQDTVTVHPAVFMIGQPFVAGVDAVPLNKMGICQCAQCSCHSEQEILAKGEAVQFLRWTGILANVANNLGLWLMQLSRWTGFIANALIMQSDDGNGYWTHHNHSSISMHVSLMMDIVVCYSHTDISALWELLQRQLRVTSARATVMGRQ